MAAVATGNSPTAPVTSDSEVYEIGGGRKTVFSLLFLLLLPFYASLPPMLAMRLKHGLWEDGAGLVILGVAFTIVMALIFSQLVYSLRSRVVLGKETVHFTLPKSTASPWVGYVSRTIPYSEIAGVETRREIYGKALAPVMMKGARLLLKDGSSVRLGYNSEADPDPALPHVEIAEKIARRAGVAVVDRGNVRRSAHKKMLGLVANVEENAPIGEDEIMRLNQQHKRWIRALILALVVMVVGGIAYDYVKEINWQTSSQPATKPTPKGTK